MESISKIAPALVKAIAQIDNPRLNSVNPHLKNKFADLHECLRVVKQPLADNGLALIQHNTNDGTYVNVTTVIVHESGETIQSTCGCEVVQGKGLNMPQSIGVCITYLRRYGIMCMLGIVGEQDCDAGNYHHEPKHLPKKITEAQAQALRKKIELSKGVDADATIETLYAHFKVNSFCDLTTSQAQAIEAKISKQGEEK